MLTDDEIAQHFAVRLVYAIASGATGAARDIDRDWRTHVAMAHASSGLIADAHAGMRDALERIAVGHAEPSAPAASALHPA